MESKAEKIISIFKNVSGRSLMVYTFPEKEEVIHFQLQMLVNNSIPGILKANSISLNGEIRLQYDITSLIPIKKLLERRKLGREDFLKLIKNIVTTVEGMEQYLLDTDRIVFDSSFIFADPQDLDFEFAYLPLKTLDHNSNTLKSFLLGLIINDIQFANEQSDNFVQKLLEILKSEDFKASDLRAYLKEMGTDKQITKEPLSVKPQDVIEEKEPTPPIQHNVKSVVKVSRPGYPTKSYVIMGSVIAVLILFCLTLVITGVMSPGNPDSLLSLFGFLLIGGAVTYLVYSKVFSPEKKIEKIALPQRVEYVNKAFTVPIPLPGNSVNHSLKQEVDLVRPVVMPAVKEAMQESACTRTKFTAPMSVENLSPLTTRGAMDYKNKASAFTEKHKDKTVILDCGKLKLPHLKKPLGNSFETIILDNFPFMLGRLESQVDYCINNPAIGKLHAEIKNTPEGYVISDMNSLNGTFVNGERVYTGNDAAIKSGDRITLGNEEFVFYSETFP